MSLLIRPKPIGTSIAFINRREFTASITGSALAAHLVLGEVLTGVFDGVNKIFTTAASVIGTTGIDVYLNGQRQKAGTDYTFTALNTVTFTVAPDPNVMTAPEADYIK